MILAYSFAGRHYAPKYNLPRLPFTMNIVAVPFLYIAAVHKQEKRMVYDSTERKTFEQNLEFYPVTRRAWNRALGECVFVNLCSYQRAGDDRSQS